MSTKFEKSVYVEKVLKIEEKNLSLHSVGVELNKNVIETTNTGYNTENV